MSININKSFLEGVRLSDGNNIYGFPPRDLVIDQTQLDQTPRKTEYVVLADTTASGIFGLNIADNNLRFIWTKNESTVQRFSYDQYARRWLPSPGSSPESIGIITNDSSNRLKVIVPDLDITNAPFNIYIGDPVRLITFSPIIVANSGSFGSPSAGFVEIAADSGELNFSSGDLVTYADKTVIYTRQSYFDRIKTNGKIGQLPVNSSLNYNIFLNPQPASSQFPRIRIGYGLYLTPIEVPNESGFGSPASGTVEWSLDTGKLNFSTTDIDDFSEEFVYYDGTMINSFTLEKISLGSINAPGNVDLPITDEFTYVFVAEQTNQTPVYFSVSFSSSSAGVVLVNQTTGAVSFSSSDQTKYAGYTIFYVKTIASLENGVAIQFFRNVVGPSATDFVINYRVIDQLIQSKLMQVGFVPLPTIPVVDDDINFPSPTYRIAQGTDAGGFFTGNLKNSADPTQFGVGYLLDFDNKQIKFSNRKTIDFSLLVPSAFFQLKDPMVSPFGFTLTKNGSPIIPGTDFSFDKNSALVEFTEPYGEGDPDEIDGIVGQITTPAIFTSTNAVFNASHEGKFLFITSGSNIGIYTINSVVSSVQVLVSPNFKQSESASAEIKLNQDIIADRFWKSINFPVKTFKLERAANNTSPYIEVPSADFSVLESTGQINLKNVAQPGEVFRVSYMFASSDNFGATYTPIPKTEVISFKIRQEQATYIPGTNIISFNPSGKEVDPDKSFTIYVDGRPQDADTFTFNPPGSISLSALLTSEVVTIGYFVKEAPGGEFNFNVSNVPIAVDTVKISANQQNLSLNGNQTSSIEIGSAFRFNSSQEILIISAISYDSTNDVTNVVFEQAPTVDLTGQTIQVSGSITGPYRVNETNTSSSFTLGTNSFTIDSIIPDYKVGTIITINGDPYYVQAVIFDQAIFKTKITTIIRAKRNYIIPSITRTVRPILDDNVVNFQTLKPPHLAFPFTLVQMGLTNTILNNGVDYQITEGGTITFTKPLTSGNEIHALYVSRINQPIGTAFSSNYAHEIAPTSGNGLMNQRLLSTYTLYGPDSFYFSIENFLSFLPQLADAISQDIVAVTVTGPNTEDVQTISNSTLGQPSLYYPEQHLENIDSTIRELLKFYNDLINLYEDLLSNIDGRVVGGLFGRFRFDGNINNNPVDSFADVKNDIDDLIKIGDSISVINFSPLDVQTTKIYAPMWKAQPLSRLYPTARVSTAFITNPSSVSNGVPISSFSIKNSDGNEENIKNITSADFMVLTNPRSKFNSIKSNSVVISMNGDATNKVPVFETTQKVTVFKPDGSIDVNEAEIGSITVVGTDTLITLKDPTTSSLIVPSVLRGSLTVVPPVLGSASTVDEIWLNSQDYSIDSETGQILNFKFLLLYPVNQLIDNKLYDSGIAFINQSTEPFKIPVLYGGILDDTQRFPDIVVFRVSEIDLINDEINSYNYTGSATVLPSLNTMQNTAAVPSVSIGSTIRFIEGPNSGLETVVQSISGASFIVNPNFYASDSQSRIYTIVSSSFALIDDILNDELGILNSNTIQGPLSGAVIGRLDSELLTINNIILNFGINLTSGTGTVTPTVLTDTTKDFVDLGITSTSLLYISSDASIGLYTIASFTNTTITINGSFAIPGSVTYVLINPYSFLGTSEFDFANEFIQKTRAFYNNTNLWKNSPTFSGISARISTIQARLVDLNNFIGTMAGILGQTDNLYDGRFAWIKQRVDMKTGTLVRKVLAQQQRQEARSKLIQNQLKLLVMNSLINQAPQI